MGCRRRAWAAGGSGAGTWRETETGAAGAGQGSRLLRRIGLCHPALHEHRGIQQDRTPRSAPAQVHSPPHIVAHAPMQCKRG